MRDARFVWAHAMKSAPALQDRLPATVHTNPVRNFAVVGGVKDRDIRVFANFDAALAVLQVEGARAVDGIH